MSHVHHIFGDLHIDNNQLSGNIPSEIGTLNSLEKLNLGEVINEYGAYKNVMKQLILIFSEYNLYWPEQNNFNSTIPTELGNLELLEVLILGKFFLLQTFVGALEINSKYFYVNNIVKKELMTCRGLYHLSFARYSLSNI